MRSLFTRYVDSSNTGFCHLQDSYFEHDSSGVVMSALNLGEEQDMFVTFFQ
jgi:hypothetical protein